MGINQKEYRNPGTGAIEYARTFVEGMEMEDSLSVIISLMKDELHDTEDKRIKRCGYCGYPYRDHTRPNNSKTCSKECKVASDTLKRRMKQADKALLNPKKKTKREEYYLDWLEYPFWLDEYEMLKQSWKHEPSYGLDKVEQIAAAKQRTELLGGRRKKKYFEAKDDRGERMHKVRVKFSQTDRKPSELKTYRMDPKEMAEYLDRKYGRNHLNSARRKALEHRKFRRSR
ncbi:hypothetical protein J0K78_17045 [Halobacillus sp. GSS1]|uniref:hypothetical protein n=1 Tax=Halobacillus sp. GSS1 TaxID=2815919 RepID=UPI001A8C732D|nr:hypothetical protein [Halobacillus sp. GSS1]MBN9655985.1 hypothetical protein [Halobacillus sp. GSS1]